MRSFQRDDGLSASIAGARSVRSRRRHQRSGSGRADHRGREDRPSGRALLSLHGRIDADRRRPGGRSQRPWRLCLCRAGRGATGLRSGAWAHLYRPTAAGAWSGGDHDPGVGQHRPGGESTGAGSGNRQPPALFHAVLWRGEEAVAPAEAIGCRRLLGRGSLCRGGDAAAFSWRRCCRDGGAVAPHPQCSGADVPEW